MLDWVIGTPHDPAWLAQLFAPLRYPRRLPTQYQSPQPWLWPLRPEERLFALPVSKQCRRRRRLAGGVQGRFTEPDEA